MRVRAWLRRLLGTFRQTPPDTELQDELALHLELAAADLERRGLSKDEAAREARLQSGHAAQAMEHRRDQRGLPWLADAWQDFRYGARMLRRAPGFSAVALLTLTLAIGVNTAVFSIVDPLLFRDLAVSDPARLVQFTWRYPGDPPLNLFSVDAYERFRDANTVFSDLAGLAPLRTPSRTSGEPIAGEVVTGNFFAALGVRPALGRVLEVSDDGPAAPPVAVVSWRYWTHRLDADARALGRRIDLEDPRLPAPLHATIVGVAEPAFSGVAVGARPDVWVSLRALPDAVRSRPGLALIARLKPGVAIEQARAEMQVLDRERIEGFARTDPQWRQVSLDVTPARAGLSTPLHDQFGGPLRLLMAIAGVLLLLACANIGGLLLARGASRQHEMAVRVSLGAGRVRILRQVLIESFLLAAAGSLLGLVGARVGAGVLMRILTSGTRSLAAPPQLDVALDARVLLFTTGVTILAAVAFGVVPALTGFTSAPLRALRAGAGGTQPRSRLLFGSGLVVAQVALSLALLSVSHLYVAHLSHLRDRSLGFDRRGVLVLSIDASRAGLSREQLTAQFKEALGRLQAIPGVRSATVSGMTPISGAAGSRFVRVDGFAEVPEARRRASLNTVAPNYFATLGTPLVAGRDFTDADASQPRRVIVNEALARRYFGGRDPIGQRLWFDADREPFEIVGLAGDAKYQDVRVAPPPIVYVYAPLSGGRADVSLRTSVPPSAIAGDARRILADALGSGAVGRVTTLADQVDAAIVPERLMASLSGFFGTIGTLLAAIGLYGLLAYSVARRTSEIGIRMALGATRGHVTRMVLTSAAWLVAAGLVLGAPAALWSKRIAASLLEHLPAGGMGPVVSGGIALTAVALLAAYLPVRRATRIDPLTALRSE